MNSVDIRRASCVVDLTLSLSTVQYSANDVLADRQELAGMFREGTGNAEIQSVVVVDKDDQGVAMDLVFLDSDVAIGTENSAVSISDTNAAKVVGIVSVTTANYVDLINSQVATKSDLGIRVQGASDQSSLWVGAITRGGTPTHTASGIVLRVGVIQD